MSFQETVNSLINDAYDCALTMEKCNIFAEASFREFDINCEEASLKVIKESGNDDDFRYLCEAAKEGLVVKLKKAIQKLIRALKDYLAKVVDKIKVTFASKQAKATLEKLEQAAGSNPKVKKIKITIHDAEQEQKAIQEAIDKLRAQEAKAKAGKSPDKVNTEVQTIKENCEKKRQKIMAAATLTITIAAAIALIKKYIASLESDNASAIKEAMNTGDDDFNPETEETSNLIYNIVSSKINLARAKVASMVASLREIWGKCKGEVSVNNPEVKNESAYEIVDDSNDLPILTPDSEVYEEVEIEPDDSNEEPEEDGVTESVDIDELFADIQHEATMYESVSDSSQISGDPLDLMLDAIAGDLTTEGTETMSLDDILDEMESGISVSAVNESTDDMDIEHMLDEIIQSV